MLPASLTAVYENNDDQYNGYWGTFDSRNRVSLSTYEDSYTFTGLKPGTVYYVALAHMTQIGETTERTLDDYYKISTITPRNSLSVSTVKSSSVEFVLQLESLNSGAKKVQLDEVELAFYTLTSDDIKTAVSRGLSGVIRVDDPDTMKGLKKIVLKVVDEEGNVLLTTRCNNSFYEEPTSGTPGGASGGTGTPVITTPSAPGTSTGTSTGSTTGSTGGTTTSGTTATPGGSTGGTTAGGTTTGGTTTGSTGGTTTGGAAAAPGGSTGGPPAGESTTSGATTGSTGGTTTSGAAAAPGGPPAGESTTGTPGGTAAGETSATGGTSGATPAASAELE